VQLLDGEMILSPTDLTGFVACRHLTELELAATRGDLVRPKREDPLLDVLTRRGTEHESDYLEQLRTADHSVVEIRCDGSTRAGLMAAEAATLDAMRSGVDFIYQATFFDGRWRGHADFLERVDRPSPSLGDWSYDVADTKLARRVKAAAVLQMAAYAEQLERLQGAAPEHLHVLAGDGQRHSYRCADFAAYHRTLKARVESLVLSSPQASYPEPVEHCSICRWAERCSRRRREDDHLSLVAGIRGAQTEKLVLAGVTTRHELAELAPNSHIAAIGDGPLERLRHQAELQVRGQREHELLYELLTPEAPPEPETRWLHRGFAALPAPSSGDLFLDLEGDPYARDEGLEYLFGIIATNGSENHYTALWAHNRAEERAAFETFIDLVMHRRRDQPDLHIYHYGAYEPSRIKRLMGLHATREREVDILLRGQVFVDLYAIVRQAVRLSSESYSLKDIERLYMTRLPGTVMDAGSSIVAYEDWLERHDPKVLDDIEIYNRDDCDSTIGLRGWLEARRHDAEARWGEIPRPLVEDGLPDEALDEREQRVADLRSRLTTRGDPAEVLLGDLLAWHRREARPEWWAYYERRDTYNDDAFIADRECIGALHLLGEVDRIRRSIVYAYEFTPQDHKFSKGTHPVDPASEQSAGTVVALDDTLGVIHLARDARRALDPHPRNLMPGKPFDTRVLEDAIFTTGEWVAEHGIDGPGPYRAVRDLLARRPPRTVGDLDHSYLAVQGPPGTGKTTEGARWILELVGQGLRVGVAGPSHAVIGNLLNVAASEAAERAETARLFQKCAVDEVCDAAQDRRLDSNAAVATALGSRQADAVGGTAWVWADPQLRDSVDVLIIDEAGQVPLANVVGMASAASSLILLGDPQQLAHPAKGTHPPGASTSGLEHLLDQHRTMPAHLGQFLATTHRMHPDVCSFISEIAYEGRLSSEPGLECLEIGNHAGIRFVPVDHTGNQVASSEEAEAVRELIDELVGQPRTTELGKPARVKLSDVLVVAPYNAQVARLRQLLPDGARIGTVDKFQGQEAAAVIYSMATSTPEDAPRGMDFLYDLHRLNVAISRTQALAYLVCSPELLQVLCRTPHQIRLANALCRYVELGSIIRPEGRSR
jgi:predicted RecB family nuclease